MKRLFYVSTANGGKVIEGFPVSTTEPSGNQVPPYVLLGNWYEAEEESSETNQSDDEQRECEWKHTGIKLLVDAGVPLSYSGDQILAKTGEIKLETTGLWLKNIGETVDPDEAVIWFENAAPEHYFTTGPGPDIIRGFTEQNTTLHYCEDGAHIVATVRCGSEITTWEKRQVRKAGTGRALFNFPKFVQVRRDVQTLRVGNLGAEWIQQALEAGRPQYDVQVEMYTLTGKRKVENFPFTITQATLAAEVKELGFSRYSEVVTG